MLEQKDTTKEVAGVKAKIFAEAAGKAEAGSALWAELTAQKLSAEGQVAADEKAKEWERRYGMRDGGERIPGK
ncbi:MAG: hypothetical protein K2Q01_00675 [Rickettsiales bacterium]|nr:hypothetical protein [Rickettsiales bacterium]